MVACCARAAPAQVEGAFATRPGFRELTGRLLVLPRPGAGPHAVSRLDPVRVRTLEPMGIHVVATPRSRTDESFARDLLATGDYRFAVPDWRVYPLGLEPNDTGFPSQWHLRKIEAPAAWSSITGSGAITIAFVDTGVDLTHPDLAPLLVPGFNVPTLLTQAQGGAVGDINGHGTGVAGAAAAMGNNGTGCCGVGWSFPIMPVRASNSPGGSAFLSEVLYGAAWAAANGARVVSVSYAGAESPAVETTGAAIMNYGGVLVWAAGNSAVSLPLDHPSAIIVGSTNSSDALAPDSNFGPAIDVVAPGVSLYLPARGGGWSWNSGTSYAAPVSAGVLALLWNADPSRSPAEAMELLAQSADDLGAPGRDTTFGWGRVNAARAVRRAVPPRGTDIDMHAAHHPGPLASQLRAEYYTVPHPDSPLAEWLPEGSGFVRDLAFALPPGEPFPGASSGSRAGAVFTGYVTARVTGAYTFILNSSDTARLYIDDRLVADNTGIHGARARSGSIGLAAGVHSLRCEYATLDGPITLELRVRGPGASGGIVPREWLSHAEAP